VTRLAPLQIRAIIIFGFAMSVAAQVILYINELSMHAVQFDNVRDAVTPLIGPLTSVATVIAWTFLTRIVPLSESQRRVLRAMYLFFAFEFLLLVLGSNYVFWPVHSFGNTWITAGIWFELIGDVAVTIGLVLAFRSFAPGVDVDDPAEMTDELSAT
jgi:hypothetical protein